MTRPWDADVAVDEALAGRLIDEQFPDLAPARVRPLAVGWDNSAFLVNEAWVFRLPRRKMGAELLEIEIEWLPVIAARLTVRVSVTERLGRPSGGYPYPFAGYRFIEGVTACSSASAPDPRNVGAFLRTLHEPAPADAPIDFIKRTDLRLRIERLAPAIERAAPQARPMLESLSSTPPWKGPRTWVHGDLYARHLVLDAGGGLAGVIDWGDMHGGDPALDLSIAWQLYDADGRRRLLDAYGSVDAETWRRARFRAVHHGVALLDYGLETGDQALERVGRRALEQALPGDR